MGVRNRSSRKNLLGKTTLALLSVLALLSLLAQGVIGAAPTVDNPIVSGAFTTTPVGADVDDWTGATGPGNRGDSLTGHGDAADDVIATHAVAPQPEVNTNNPATRYDGHLAVQDKAPPIPPPQTLGSSHRRSPMTRSADLR